MMPPMPSRAVHVFALLAALSLPALISPARAELATGATVGGFVRVTGAVSGALPTQPPASKKVASPAFFGESIITGADGGATIGFIDHSHLLLSKNASITIDAFVYNPKTGEETAAYTLATGAARLISGAIKGDSLRVNTPNATLIVRGTNVKLKVTEDGRTLVSVNSGAVELSAAGSATKVRLGAGQSATVDRDGVKDVSNDEADMDDAMIDDPALDGEPDLPEADLAELGFSDEDIAELDAALAEDGEEAEADEAEADESESEDGTEADSVDSDSDGGGE